MPSQKPRITVYTDEITNRKLAYIADLENRSSSNYTEYLIKKDIKRFEEENGEIILPEKPTKTETDAKKAAIKVLKAVTGVSAGEALGDIIVDHIKSKEDK